MTAATIPMSEYLASSYRPDRDYVDGRLKKRHVGEWDHSLIQTEALFLLSLKEDEWNIHVLVSVRVQISFSRIRVPAVCVLPLHHERESVVRTTIPLLCIEVMSTLDTLERMRKRVADYFSQGIQTVWILDPQTRTAYQSCPDYTTELMSGELTVPDTPIALDVETIFQALDR